MAKGIPSSKGPGVVALKAKRLEDVPIARIGAFRAVQTRKDEQTGEEYEIEQVKLSIDLDSGHPQRNENGELVLDRNGNQQIHYINEGFVTLSGDKRAKLVDILKAAGFDGPEFIEQEGKNEGGLRDDVAATIEAEFGTNGLGHDYSGLPWEDLPMYTPRSQGGKHDKREVEVPIHSLKIAGYELIGRKVDVALEIKGGYNRVSAYIPPRNPEPLRKGVIAPARGVPAVRGEPEPVDDPFDDDSPLGRPAAPPPAPLIVPTVEEHGKGPAYVWQTMDVVNIPEDQRVAVARYLLGEPALPGIHAMNVEQCRIIRDMFKADPSILAEAYRTIFGDADDDDEF